MGPGLGPTQRLAAAGRGLRLVSGSTIRFLTPIISTVLFAR
jgi:hypothetical protein